MRKIRITITLFLFAALALNAIAQESDFKEKEIPVDVSVELKNAHIWRGLDVTHNFLMDANVRLMDKTNTFAVGLWGATTFTKDFREFDYYVGFYKSGFSIEVWDVLNFSEKNQYDPYGNPGGYNTEKAFDYSARGTGHFVDVRLAYQLPEAFPLRLGWSTVVFGRDRVHLTDITTNPASPKESFSSSRYSTYVEAEYPLLKGNIVDVKIGVAGAFALKEGKINDKKIKGHFYGKSSGIVNANLTVSKNLQLTKNYNLPISVMAVWNPEANKTYMQVALQVLQF